MFDWSPRQYAFVGYEDVPGYPAKSMWRDSLMNSADHSGWARTWGPGCSFPTGTRVYGWTSLQEPTATLNFRIFGSSYTGKHKCA
jgi:hypothetical protein